LGRGVFNFVSVTEGDLAAGFSDRVKAGAHGPTAGFEHLRRVIESIRLTGDEEVREARPLFDSVAPGKIHHSLLGGNIRQGGCREFAGRRVEKCRLV
jgi:hypothetical protein